MPNAKTKKLLTPQRRVCAGGDKGKGGGIFASRLCERRDNKNYERLLAR